MSDEYDYLFKSIVVGDGGVGKTALTLRFSKGFFTEDYKMTIGVDFHVKTIEINTEDEGMLRVKLQIWDTGGQERFSSIRPMYYRGSLGALLIFDLTSYESFEHLPQWIEEIRANIKNEIPLLLVGNKSDLIDERKVSFEEINDFTNKFNLYYMETSAKTGEGVGDCFYILACLMVGADVPYQLVSQRIVYNPGHVSAAASGQSTETIPFIPEPNPYLEPEPEIEFSAPPIPEPTTEEQIEPPIEQPINEALEFEFKTPDEILSEEIKEEVQETSIPEFPETSMESESPIYKPKAVPFSSNIPVPAPVPEGFRTTEKINVLENSTKSTAPFLVAKSETYGPSSSESESLVDYMPKTILSKKEVKKLEKQKKKEEQESKIQEEKEKAKLEKEKKLQEKKEKAAKLKEDMQKVKKEKKEKKEKTKKEKIKDTQITPTIPFQTGPTPKSDTSTLFQALSQKTEDVIPTTSDKTIPFIPTESKEQEVPKYGFIPNVSDIDSKAALPASFTSVPTVQHQDQKPRKKEIIICQQCGSILSSDYAFCNKCGSKL